MIMMMDKKCAQFKKIASPRSKQKRNGQDPTKNMT